VTYSTQNFSFEPIYVLHGTESFLLNDFVAKIEEKFKGQNNFEQNIKTFDCTTDSIKEIFTYSSLSSLVGKKMIIVKNIQNCKELSNKKILEFVEKYAQYPNPHNILILYSDRLLPVTNAFLKIFSKHKIERFIKFKDNEIINFIRQQVTKSSIDNDAIALLRLFTGDDLQILAKELEKLTQHNHFEKIDEKIILEYISFQRNYNPFEFLNAIVEKNSQLLEKILKNNEDLEAISIVALLYAFFTKIMMMHTDKISQETFYQKYYQNARRTYSLEKIETIMQLLLESDLQLKGIKTIFVDDKEVLQNLIFKIIS
jgi:DNA polymerase-3 subunit delta